VGRQLSPLAEVAVLVSETEETGEGRGCGDGNLVFEEWNDWVQNCGGKRCGSG